CFGGAAAIMRGFLGAGSDTSSAARTSTRRSGRKGFGAVRMDSAGSLGGTLRAAKSDAAAFRPRFPWLTGDLQTVRNMIVRPRPRFADAPAQGLACAMYDGTGDVSLGDLHLRKNAARPLAILIHGLTGCGDSFYVLTTARALLDRGFPVLRLNLRGAGPNAGSCREQYHAGRTADLRKVLGALD